MPVKKTRPEKWPEEVPLYVEGYEKPLFSLLDDTAGQYPQLPYTIYQGASRSYATVKETAEKVAGFLMEKGVKKGDKVAIFLPNIPQFPEIFFGILKAGAVCVNCNPLYTADELNFQLKDCGARFVFCMDHPEFYPTTVAAAQNTQIETVIICGVKSYLPAIKGFLGGLLGKIPKADHYEPGHLFFDDLIKNSNVPPEFPAIAPVEDMAMILYTSGTTGRPKGACLTHANMVFAVRCLHDWVHVQEKPGEKAKKISTGGSHVFLGILPWYHIFGLWTCMFWPCLTGNSVVCIPDPRNGTPPFTEALQSIEKYKVSIFAAVPSIFTAITNHAHLGKYDLSSIIACASGAAPLATETLRRFEKATGAVIFEGYGLSEFLPIGINPTNLDDRKIGSVGMPCIGTSVKIVDLETGMEELPQGEDGEIAASGPQMMRGYLNRPDTDATDFRTIDNEKYFLTGDIGHIDAEGYLIITDRKKDMILVGGFNVYPAEVEDALISHPKVALAAVIGIPGEDKKESVRAYVQLSPGETATQEEILEHCKNRLSGYKRPRNVEFRDEIPTSIVGKVVRRVLKEEVIGKK